MARVPGRKTKIYCDEWDLSGRVSAIELPFDITLPEVTCFGDSAGEFVEGLCNSKLIQNSFFDPADNAIDEEMWADLVSGSDHLLGVYPGNSAIQGQPGYELQARPDDQARPIEIAGAVLLNVSWQGFGPVVRSTVLANGAVTGTGAVSGSNKNVGGTGVHLVNDTTNTATAAAASDAASLYTLLNELKADYNAHRISTTFHLVADSTNVVAAADADTEAKAVTLSNELKADINAHRSQSGVHNDDDNSNIIGRADSTDEATAILLANDIKTHYNAHLLKTQRVYVAILRVLSVTGSGSIVVEVEESQDDAVGDAYVQLTQFATATGITSERKTLTTMTEKWKRINVTTFSGFSSVTILVVVGYEQGT